MKLRDASLQVYEKTVIHPLSCVLPFNEVARCQPASLGKKTHTSSFMYFAFHPPSSIFSEYITITYSEEALKACQHNFFQRKVILLVIYLFNYDSFKSTMFMVNMALDRLLSAIFLK